MKKRLLAKAAAAIGVLRQADPAPQGRDAEFFRNAVRILEPALPSMLEVSLIFMACRRDSNHRGTGPRLIPEIASGVWVTASFNGPGNSLNQPLPEGDMLTGGLPMYRTGTRLEGTSRGEPVTGGRPERNSTRVFIASNPLLPLRPVTREEPLQAHRPYWLNKTQEDRAQPAESTLRGLQRTLAGMEQRRAAYCAGFEQKRQDLLDEMRSPETQAEEGRALGADVDRRSAAQLARLFPAERNLPAIQDLSSSQYAGLRFETGPAARPVVVAGDAFHSPRPDRAAVQAITVLWRRVPGSAIQERAMHELLKRLGFNALRALLAH